MNTNITIRWLRRYVVPVLTCVMWVFLVWWMSTWLIISDRKPIPHWKDWSSWTNLSITQNPLKISDIVSASGIMFSSPKESFDEWRKVIGTATWNLDIRMYDITYNRAKLDLVRLAQNNVPIRLILEDHKYQSFTDSYVGTKSLLEDVGVKIMSDSDLELGTNFVHAKVFVSSWWTMIQTANLTDWWFNTSREYYTVLTESWIVHNMQELFDADWRGKPLTASQIHPNILVCPINCRSTIQSLISHAKSSIWIQNQYIEDAALRSLLLSQKKKIWSWLDMKIIVANNDFTQDTLKLFPKEAKWLISPYPHAKMILIDDTYLVVSSINLSTNSMDRNREIGVIITNRDAIEYFKTRFIQDYHKAKDLSWIKLKTSSQSKKSKKS